MKSKQQPNGQPTIQKEIPSIYKAELYENNIYKKWEESGAFQPYFKKNSKAKPFVISMPPPNATGTLHLGHAVMLSIQDIMTRYNRMKGRPTLWLPGTDHASIATQNKVEKIIAEEGKNRHQLGREKFLQRVEEFVKNSQNTIRNQIRKMGSSCDWSRERYTLEPMLSRAVREIFVRMYNDGLIYRGNRIVNWCPRCTSTLAEDEVKYKEEKSKFYYFRYGPFVIGTARPETKFLDKIIVVHPDDKRYKKFIGKEFTVPWIEGEVKAKVLADKSANPDFGTGAMTITPAHDFIDFEIAQRHNLEIVQIIDEKGNLTKAAGLLAGKNARAVREEIVQKLKEKDLVEKIDENYVHNISLCYRCDTPIEPLISRQWFISVDRKLGKSKKTLKQMAIDVVKKEKIKILPKNFEKIYFNWMKNLHDWCISRQIWFGHQIPVWYCECEKIIVSTQSPKKCLHCGSKKLKQEADTLDTWFSSGLWTFSTLGWPEKTRDLKFFHPTEVLETGYDIIFFWVARMIIMTQYALNEVPFKVVYLHGLVRTRDGKKMSKSDPKTCIDPLDMIEKYGADALRLSMIIGSAPGNDIRLYEEKIAGYRNFVNKIWNAARFTLLNGTKEDKKITFSVKYIQTSADKWILTRLQRLIKEVTKNMDQYRFSDAGTKIYDFLWSELCDWYLEMSKGADKNSAVLIFTLKTTLKLLHPFVPYITEVLWEYLGEKGILMKDEWPKFEKKFSFENSSREIELLHKIITGVRAIRAQHHIELSKKIHAVFYAGKKEKLLQEKEHILKKFANLEHINITKNGPKIDHAIRIRIAEVEVYLPLADMVNLEEQWNRIRKERNEKKSAFERLKNLLENKNFLEKAPVALVTAEKKKFDQLKEELEKILEQEKDLEKMRKM